MHERNSFPIRSLSFIQALRAEDIPGKVLQRAALTLLDTCGVAAAGSRLKAAALMKSFARRHYAHAPSVGADSARLLFDGNTVSPGGTALAAGQAVDSMDAHDGHHEVKGSHISATLLGGLLALSEVAGKRNGLSRVTGDHLLTLWIIGQEMAIRCACALQSIRPEAYIPSGLPGALGVAAMGGRLCGLAPDTTRHALGIAELYGPRIQTDNGWRVTIAPSMLKDTIAWGAMAGVNAVLMARDGFTGAPCGLIEDGSCRSSFHDLGERWRCSELYMKPVPCCRYAIPAVRSVLQLLAQEGYPNGLSPDAVAELRVTTFREACLLGRDIPVPDSAEVAQYHVGWPVAAAAMTGQLPGPEAFSEDRIADDTELRSMCGKIKVVGSDEYTKAFPRRTYADVRIEFVSGRKADQAASSVANNGLMQGSQARETLLFNQCDPDLGLCTQHTLLEKFTRYASWGLGSERAGRIKEAILGLPGGSVLAVDTFLDALLAPIAQPKVTREK